MKNGLFPPPPPLQKASLGGRTPHYVENGTKSALDEEARAPRKESLDCIGPVSSCQVKVLVRCTLQTGIPFRDWQFCAKR